MGRLGRRGINWIPRPQSVVCGPLLEVPVHSSTHHPPNNASHIHTENIRQRVDTSPPSFTTYLLSFLRLFPQLIINPNLQLRRAAPRKVASTMTPNSNASRSSRSFRSFHRRSRRTKRRRTPRNENRRDAPRIDPSIGHLRVVGPGSC